MYCQKCGKENKDGYKFCKYCGSRFHELIVCSSCGMENKQGSKFCKFCGSGLITAENAESLSEVETAVNLPEFADNYGEYEKHPDDYETNNVEVEADTDEDAEIEKWFEGVDDRPIKPERQSKRSSPRRNKQDIYIDNRVLISLMAVLGVLLIALGMSLVAYFKTGSLNPSGLFDIDKTEDVADTDNDVEEKKEKETAGSTGSSDVIEVVDIMEKKTEEESPVDVDLFAEFIAGNVKAVVADDFLCSIEWTNEMKSGQEYTFQEIKDYVLKDEKISYESFENPDAYYFIIHVHGGIMNALKLSYSLKDNESSEGLDETYVFYDNNGKLEIKFAIDESNFGTGPSMRGGSVDASGVSNYYAHGGAGESQYSRMYAPDSDFSYKMIYDEESHIAYDPYFYDTNNMPIEPLNLTMEEAASMNESAQYVRYYREIIDNDVFFYYLNDGEEGLTQSTVDFIDTIAAGHGFGFDGKATADAAREAYEKELGVYEICQDHTSPEWIDIE